MTTAASVQQVPLHVPGYRVTLTSQGTSGQVTLSKPLTRDCGYNLREGRDTQEARRLRDQVRGEIRQAAREAGVAMVQVYASKRGAQDWLVDCIECIPECCEDQA